MLVLVTFAVLAGRRHGPVAVRAAGAAGAALGGRRRRPAPPLGDRARPVDRRSRSRSSASRTSSTASASATIRCATSRSSCCSFSASSLLVPDLAARLEAPLSRLARFGPRTRGDGFALGAARRRRARLRLHAVREPDPRGGDLRQRRQRPDVAIGARLRARLGARAARADARRPARVRPRPQAGRGPLLQRALGVIMILTAVAIVTNLDVNFDQFVAAAHSQRQPRRRRSSARTTVTSRLPRSPVTRRSSRRPTAARPAAAPPRSSTPRRDASQATLLADARTPAISAQRPNSRTPRTGSTRRADARCRSPALRGRVVLVDFWTYTCINCIRTLPYLKAWDAAYAKTA